MKLRKGEGAEASRPAWSALLVGFCMLLLPIQSDGQERLDLQAIVQETQKTSEVPGEMTLVWWLPEQFWQASQQQRQGPTPAGAEANQLLQIVRRYTLIAVVDGRIGPLGGVTFKTEEAVRGSVTLKDAKGASYVPLGESSVDPDMKNLLQMMKPIVANMLGPMGQNMYFVLFPSKSDDGRLIGDPASEGMLYVVVGANEFKYRLPLGSVLPRKYDPGTGETFPGNYNYNPFTGTKLVTESSNKPLQPTR